MLEDVSVLADDDALDSAVSVLQRGDAMVEAHRNSALLRARGERLPHLARAEARVAELFDQRRHVPPLESEDREDRLPEREVLDPLCCPQRADLRAWDAPYLFRVRTEEGVVEPSAEARGDPLL